jgi:phage FluMu gp28-like protein
VLAAHKALTVPGSLTLILAPSERQARETFAKTADFLRGETSESDRKLGVQLANGSRIEALPGTEKTIRGYSGVDLLILDEAARVEDVLYWSIRPMLAVSGGRLIMASTPHGKRGVFHQEWTEGSGWERYEVPATEVPRIPAGFLEEERAALPERVFRQEYMCAFEEVDDSVFTYDVVDQAVTPEVAPLFGAAL